MKILDDIKRSSDDASNSLRTLSADAYKSLQTALPNSFDYLRTNSRFRGPGGGLLYHAFEESQRKRLANEEEPLLYPPERADELLRKPYILDEQGTPGMIMTRDAGVIGSLEILSYAALGPAGLLLTLPFLGVIMASEYFRRQRVRKDSDRKLLEFIQKMDNPDKTPTAVSKNLRKYGVVDIDFLDPDGAHTESLRVDGNIYPNTAHRVGYHIYFGIRLPDRENLLSEIRQRRIGITREQPT